MSNFFCFSGVRTSGSEADAFLHTSISGGVCHESSMFLLQFLLKLAKKVDENLILSGGVK